MMGRGRGVLGASRIGSQARLRTDRNGDPGVQRLPEVNLAGGHGPPTPVALAARPSCSEELSGRSSPWGWRAGDRPGPLNRARAHEVANRKLFLHGTVRD